MVVSAKMASWFPPSTSSTVTSPSASTWGPVAAGGLFGGERWERVQDRSDWVAGKRQPLAGVRQAV